MKLEPILSVSNFLVGIKVQTLIYTWSDMYFVANVPYFPMRDNMETPGEHTLLFL